MWLAVVAAACALASALPQAAAQVSSPSPGTWVRLWASGDSAGPAPRYEHVSVVLDKDTIWLHGGYTGREALADTWLFHPSTRQWSSVQSAVSPPAVASHCAVATSDGSAVFIFGGAASVSDDLDTVNTVWRFDVGTQEWSPVATSGTLPAPRQEAECQFAGADSVSLDGYLVVFGGVDPAGAGVTAYGDVWALSLTDATWRKLLDTGAGPVKRYSMASTMTGVPADGSTNYTADGLVMNIIAGRTEGRQRSFDGIQHDVWRLHLSGDTTSVLDAAWHKQSVQGHHVSRYYHSATAFQGESLVFGGHALFGPDATGSVTVCFFDTAVLSYTSGSDVTWLQAALADSPGPRVHHTSVAINHTVYILGGRSADPVPPAISDVWAVDLADVELAHLQPSACEKASQLRFFSSTHFMMALLSLLAVCMCVFCVSLRRTALRRRRHHLFLAQFAGQQVSAEAVPGASQAVVDALPVTTFRKHKLQPAGEGAAHSGGAGAGTSVGGGVADDDGSNTATCAVCLSDFEDGEQMKTLPCNHRYHPQCIDRWLLSNRSCPMCKRSVDVSVV